jgi:hypothetical protein
MKKIIPLLIAISITFFAVGQSNNYPKNGMNKFRFMVGIWKGNGWVMEGNTKHFFEETESVTNKLRDTIIQIEAFGVDKNDTTKIINDALGLLVLNEKKPKLHIYQADGSFSIAEVKLIADNEIEWSLMISDSLKIKYIIKVDGNIWIETGFKSINGIDWSHIFEMNLLKLK